MADAQLSFDDPVRAVLLQSHEEFRQLVSEHHSLDQQVQQLSSTATLTEQEKIQETALKKRKLAIKDRIEHIVRQHAAAHPSPLRA